MEENKKTKEELNNVLKELEGQNEAKNSKEKTDNSDTKETKIQYIIIPLLIVCIVIVLLVILSNETFYSFFMQEYDGEYDVQYNITRCYWTIT